MEIIVQHLDEAVPVECSFEDGRAPTIAQVKRSVADAVGMPEENFLLETIGSDTVLTTDPELRVDSLSAGDVLRTTPSPRGQALMTLAAKGLQATPTRDDFVRACSADEPLALLYIVAGYPVGAIISDPIQNTIRHPLWFALGSVALVEALVERGAEVNLTLDKAPSTPSYLLRAVKASNVAVAEVLVRHGADVRVVCNRGFAALHYAAQLGAEGLCTALLDHGAAVDVTSMLAVTPLHNAIRRGCPQTCRILLDRGACPNLLPSATGSEKPPLCSAITQGDETIVQMLLAHPNINFSDACVSLRTALSYAAQHDADLCASLAGRCRADINRLDCEGRTPLFYAVAAAVPGKVGAVQALLQHGADPNLVGGESLSCLALAGTRGNVETMRVLVAGGADVCATMKAAKLPVLSMVVWHDAPREVLDFLIEHGAGEVDMDATLAYFAAQRPDKYEVLVGLLEGREGGKGDCVRDEK